MVRYSQILLTWNLWLPIGIPGLTSDLHTLKRKNPKPKILEHPNMLTYPSTPVKMVLQPIQADCFITNHIPKLAGQALLAADPLPDRSSIKSLEQISYQSEIIKFFSLKLWNHPANPVRAPSMDPPLSHINPLLHSSIFQPPSAHSSCLPKSSPL